MQALPESSIEFATEERQDSNGMVMECLMLCRLCAALVQVSMLVSVFGDEADNDLREMIDQIIPGQVKALIFYSTLKFYALFRVLICTVSDLKNFLEEFSFW